MSKSPKKRLRIFAGPNGSGKSDLSQALKNPKDKRIKLGVFVNADEIEQQIRETGCLKLDSYKVKATTEEVHAFIERSGMPSAKLNKEEVIANTSVSNNEVRYNDGVNSYLASVLASFIREKLLQEGISFAFETVFSHESKLELMKRAKEMGYRVYLYFITTEDPQINVNRVQLRVEKGGHPVPEEKIISRYDRTMGLLYQAIKLSYRAFLFDNSGKHYELVAAVEPGNRVQVTDYDKHLPNWFVNYVFKGK